jgi:hypothetical protein
MKKILLTLFSLLFVFAVSEVNAQSTTASAKAKDEYWGTKKNQKGVGADAVGKRGSGLNQRFNEYGNPSKTDRLLSNTKRMKEIQKKEKKMLQKHAREKRKFERQRKKKKFLFF